MAKAKDERLSAETIVEMLRSNVDQIRLLQQPGGRAFTQFVDSLIRTHTAVAGIPDSAVETNLRTNLGDEGADTAIAGSDASDTTGRLGAPTVWQYKATAYKNIGTTKDLMKGKFLRARIKEGYGYRLAVADSITSAQRRARTDALTKACRRINPKAPPALIVSAEDLVEWVDRYPALVLAWFFQDLRDVMLHLDAWGSGVTSATPHYVKVPDWDTIEAQLSKHVDPAQQVPSVLRTLQGEAGVGKSRLVYEVLCSMPGMSGLAVVTHEEDASLRVARVLANAQGDLAAVLVADECGPEAREQLRKILQGRRNRVRVIAIDNSGQRDVTGDPEVWLQKMPGKSLEEILEVNFSHIVSERRRAYAELAKGYPRLASDLCAYDSEIMAAGGDVGPAMPTVREFLEIRLTDAQRDALNAVALLNKVGFRGEVVSELDMLCTLVRIDPGIARKSLALIQRGPGFVAQAGRYYYVTPEIIAQVGFEQGWQRWAEDDAQAFLKRIPDELLSAFLNRVQTSASQEVRRVCGEYFRDWASGVQPDGLVDEQTTARLVGLVDTHPHEYLPRLRRLVESATNATLADITGESRNGRWGPRRALVWLAERFARFPEYFDDAERILLRLAVAESEPKIGNNATAIWAQLFRVYLSGTATSFSVRLSRLRERLLADEPEVRELASRGLNSLFNWTGTRMGGNALVGGRIPPDEWRPATAEEEASCLRAALNLAAEIAQSGNADTESAVISGLAEHVRGLVARGYLDDVRAIFDRATLSDGERIDLLESIDSVLLYDVTRGGADQSVIDRVNAWREALVGTDLHSRLVAIVGKQRWGATRLRDASWESVLNGLAQELAAHSDTLNAELPWLFGPDAHAAGELGAALALLDPGGVVLEDVLRYALESEQRAFARGYVSVLLERFPIHADRVNQWLDAHETGAPAATADMAIAGRRQTNALERSLRLYDRGLLPAGVLYERNFLVDSEWLPDEAYEELLVRLANAAAKGDEGALRVGLDGLAMRFHGRPEIADSMLERSRTRESAWILVARVASGAKLTTYFWNDVLEALGRAEPRKAADVAAQVLIGEAFGARDEVERALQKIAESHPTDVMDAVGAAALDEKRGWVFHLAAFGNLIGSIPTDVVQSWVEREGVEAARRLARHLPPPHVVEGTPSVPRLTAWVLTKYADDDRVFREFCAGVHSFQVYHGDIAGQMEAEAETARVFRDHPIARIRQWAEIEERRALAEAKQERLEEAERDLR